MKKLRILSVICLLVMAMMAVTCTADAAGTTAWVYTSNGKPLNCRSSMLTHCNNRIDSLPNGYQVTVLSTSGDWSYIQFTHTTTGRTMKGYVQSRYLSTSSSKAAVGVTTDGMQLISPTTVTARPSSPTGWVNMRNIPSKSGSTVIGTYKQGQTLTMTAKGSTWAAVYDPSTGKSGYMMLAYLSY